MVVEKDLGQLIQRLREKAGLSQAALAEQAGVKVGTLRNWEQGRREPLLSAAARLAVALGVELGELIPTGEEVAPTEPPKRGRPRKTGPVAEVKAKKKGEK